MAYLYLEKLNKPSLVQSMGSSLDEYDKLVNPERNKIAAHGETSMADRIQLYERLKALRASSGSDPVLDETIRKLESGFSKIDVTMQSATKSGEMTYLLDKNGNRVTMLQLLNNPNETYHWQSEGSGAVGKTSYSSSKTDSYSDATSNYTKTKNSTVDGVTHKTDSGCTSTTHTFEASGKTILGDIASAKTVSNTALFYLDFSPDIFK
ncbi:MAG: hypothetical protein JSR58_06885 [Verrucomicrobia bacterium]|nr:hypothetical protein [Verrucomicrobiota bacterium]